MKPLILLHGATGSGTQFQPLVHQLKDFVNYSFNFEGHGEALPTEREFRIEHFAENLQYFIEHHDLAPARIVGYSMGGYVALWLAAHRPELIHSIITLGTNLAWSPAHAQQQVRFLNADAMEEKVPAYAAELKLRHAVSDWRLVLAKTANMMLDLGENPRLTAEVFSRIQCRVRYGVGDRDKMVSFNETLEAYRATPNAEFYVLPDTEHPLDRVSPKRWAALIRDFFSEN